MILLDEFKGQIAGILGVRGSFKLETPGAPTAKEGTTLTIEKLTDIKTLFEQASRAKKGPKVTLEELHNAMGVVGLTEVEFKGFFQEFVGKGVKEMTEQDFDQQMAKTEKPLLEVLAGSQEELKVQSVYYPVVAAPGDLQKSSETLS